MQRLIATTWFRLRYVFWTALRIGGKRHVLVPYPVPKMVVLVEGVYTQLICDLDVYKFVLHNPQVTIIGQMIYSDGTFTFYKGTSISVGKSIGESAWHNAWISCGTNVRFRVNPATRKIAIISYEMP